MRKLINRISVSLAIMAVLYGLVLKYGDTPTDFFIDTEISPAVILMADSVDLEKILLTAEEPN